MRINHLTFLFCITASIYKACFAEPIPITLKTQTFYDDRNATAMAYFTEVITAPDVDEGSTHDCRIIGIRVEKTSKDSGNDHTAIIQFRPMRSGAIELPALEFKAAPPIQRDPRTHDAHHGHLHRERDAVVARFQRLTLQRTAREIRDRGGRHVDEGVLCVVFG